MLRKWLATVTVVVFLLALGLMSFTVQGASTTVLYDANVSLSMTLRPGTTLNRADVNNAIQADAAANGVADRYVITIKGTAQKNDYVYPILMGAGGTEAWPSGQYSSSYSVSRSSRTIYGTILGSEFTSRGDAPANVYLYAESGNSTFTVTSVKVEAVRNNATAPTNPSSQAPTNAVIFDSNVSGSLSLRPSADLVNSAIASALQAENATYGVADRYIITVQASASPTDYIYPILMGAARTEVWPSNDYDHNYRIGANGTITGVIPGGAFTNAGDVPANLLFYAESGNATVTLSHVKIEVVRKGGQAVTTQSTTSTTRTTTSTTRSTTSTTRSTTRSTTSTTSTTRSTTSTTKATQQGATNAVIFDANVSGSLSLRPSAIFNNSAIAQALAAENAAYGVADRYIITVQASASPTDYIYPILMGASSGEAWPSNNYDHNYYIGSNGTIYGVLPGSAFTNGATPANLLFYAESGNATVTVSHVKIEVVRKGGQATTQSTTSTTRSTTRSTTSTTKTTTSTTKTTTRTNASSNDPVIFDANVSGTLSLTPGKTFESAAITAALEAETAAHGVADRYIITATASASPSDYIYPVLIGKNGTEGWTNNNYDHSYYIGSNGTIVGSVLGSTFKNTNDAPASLFFYADGENATVTVSHIKIEVVRAGQTQATSSTTRSQQNGTTPTVAPVNDGHPHFNYNTSTNFGSLGVWWWTTSTAMDANARDVRLNFLQSNHVTEIYLWANGMSNSQIATFIRAAASRGMRVAWLSGDVSWLENSGFDSFYNQYNAYQAQASSDAKFYAMHLDVEPHQWGNTAAIWQEYADLVVRAGNKAHGAGHKIEWDIPYWLEGKTATAGGMSGALLNILASYSDTLCLMSYRDTASGILNAGNEEYGLGSAYNCKIVLGVETYSEEGNSVSFMEEGKAAMYNALTSVMSSLAGKSTLTAGYGCAIHQIEVWLNLHD